MPTSVSAVVILLAFQRHFVAIPTGSPTSSPSALNCRVGVLELDPGILGREAPVDATTGALRAAATPRRPAAGSPGRLWTSAGTPVVSDATSSRNGCTVGRCRPWAHLNSGSRVVVPKSLREWSGRTAGAARQKVPGPGMGGWYSVISFTLQAITPVMHLRWRAGEAGWRQLAADRWHGERVSRWPRAGACRG